MRAKSAVKFRMSHECLCRATDLGYVMYRMGLLAVLRARYKHGESCQVFCVGWYVNILWFKVLLG